MKIHVANLALETTSADLRAAFAGVGEVKTARVIYDRTTGRSRSFGFVEMTNRDEAQVAIVALGRAQLHGHQLRLSESVSNDDNDDNGEL